MHKAILLLVETHSKVNDVSPPLVRRVLEELVNEVTEVALRSFQKITQFGTGGMLMVSRPQARRLRLQRGESSC